jgi:hypothetical protein
MTIAPGLSSSSQSAWLAAIRSRSDPVRWYAAGACAIRALAANIS